MRWIRYIFALIAVTSLCIWVMSHIYIIGAQYTYQKGNSLTCSSGYGFTTFGVSHGGIPQPPAIGWKVDIKTAKEIEYHFEMMGDIIPDMKHPREYLSYGYSTFNHADPGGKWTWSGADFTIPLWLPTLLFALWPAIAFTRHIKRRYFSPGICRKCGYDLRGTPSGICPECGRSSKPHPDDESTSTNAQT